MNKKTLISTGSLVVLMSISLTDVVTLKSYAHMTDIAGGCRAYFDRQEYDKWGKCVKRSGMPSCEKAWQTSDYSGNCYRGLPDGRVIQTDSVRGGKRHVIPFVHHANTESNCRGVRYLMIKDYFIKNYFKAHYRNKNMPKGLPFYGEPYNSEGINWKAYSDWALNCQKEARKCQWKPIPPKGNGWVRMGIYVSGSAKFCLDTYARKLSTRGKQIEIQTQVTHRWGEQTSPNGSDSEIVFIRCNTWEQLGAYSDRWRPMVSNTIGSDAAKKFC
ncbi:hypothetical protein N9S87_00330 [Synechococcus sp. AH-779-G23]|nr:hypothetical protein [Synechococcus sp. AH-779-G23]MDA9638911.1 hypothetical protein [Synechococcus sp. AH-779-G23]